MHAIMPQTALFCIDIQHHLALDPTTLIPHAPRVLAASTAILAHARTRIDAARASGETPDLEIIVVQHDETPEKGPLQKGSEAWEVVFPPREGDECERLVGKDVRECAFSSFFFFFWIRELKNVVQETLLRRTLILRMS